MHCELCYEEQGIEPLTELNGVYVCDTCCQAYLEEQELIYA